MALLTLSWTPPAFHHPGLYHPGTTPRGSDTHKQMPPQGITFPGNTLSLPTAQGCDQPGLPPLGFTPRTFRSMLGPWGLAPLCLLLLGFFAHQAWSRSLGQNCTSHKHLIFCHLSICPSAATFSRDHSTIYLSFYELHILPCISFMADQIFMIFGIMLMPPKAVPN